MMKTFILLTISCIIILSESGRSKSKSGSNRGSSNRNYNGGWSSSSNTPSPVTSSSNNYNSGGWNNGNSVPSNTRSNCWGRNRRNGRKSKRNSGSSWSKSGSGNDGDHGYTYSTTLDEDCDDDDDDTNSGWLTSSTYPPESPEEYTTTSESGISISVSAIDTALSTTEDSEEEDTSTTTGCTTSTFCPCEGETGPVCCDGQQYDSQCHAECDCYFNCDEGECPLSNTTAAMTTTDMDFTSSTPMENVLDCPNDTRALFAPNSTAPCECFEGLLAEGCPFDRCELVEPEDGPSFCITPENAAVIDLQEEAGEFLAEDNSGNTFGAIGGSIAAMIVIPCCLMLALFCWKRRVNKYDNIAVADDIEEGIEIGVSTTMSTKTGLDGEESQEIGYETQKTQNIVRDDSSDDGEMLVEDDVALPDDDDEETQGRVLNALIGDGNDNYTQR